MKRVLIAAGGTGGHFYPGLVTAQTLKARAWQPLIVIRKDDPAKARLASEGLAWTEVDLRGLPRKPGLELLAFTAQLFASLGLLSRVVRDFRPDLVLGMGGYLTVPASAAAWRHGVACALHESNAVLGLANTASLKLGAKLFRGLPGLMARSPGPRVGPPGPVVGTPVRPELYVRRSPGVCRRALGLDVQRATVLVFGGSQGAQAINALLAGALKAAGQAGAQVLHLAGRGKTGETRNAYRSAGGVDVLVLDYLDDMSAAYGAADLVVCRSGAGTLAELAALRKPAILIPYPHATANHQDANARVFERAGAAARIAEADLAEKLAPALADLLTSETAAEKRTTMSKAYDRLGLPPAEKITELFVDALEKMSPT